MRFLTAPEGAVNVAKEDTLLWIEKATPVISTLRDSEKTDCQE